MTFFFLFNIFLLVINTVETRRRKKTTLGMLRVCQPCVGEKEKVLSLPVFSGLGLLLDGNHRISGIQERG